MSLRFTVLASGSGGNASLLEVNGFGLLLDAGLGPRQLAQRLVATGKTWSQVHAVLLTHTHSDHWKNPTLAHLGRKQIPLYCHPDHHPMLRTYGPAFAPLHAAGLVRPYEPEQELLLGPGIRCRPLPLPHDGGATFGFRLEASGDLFGRTWAVGYVADLGSWNAELAQGLADVDLLALEFNHDVDLEYASGRSPYLIARVLGANGHLSNAQAAALLQEVLRRSTPGRLRQVVQLHLSRECNRPALALAAARMVLGQQPEAIPVHTASQDETSPTFIVGTAPQASVALPAPRPPRRKTVRSAQAVQAWLPGMEC
jgi:phosphoribosyl 1,2-cyclic phosphodiesterase